MKTLRKLEINPARLMKDEELVTVRGGYDTVACAINIDGFSWVYIGFFEGDCATIQAQQTAYWGAYVGCWGGNCSVMT